MLDELTAAFARLVKVAADMEAQICASGRAAQALADLADANGITVEEAAAITRATQEQYGLDQEQMAYVVDLIVGASKATPIDVAELERVSDDG